MSNLLKKLREDVTSALVSSDIVRRNVLKVVIGEAEMTALRQNKDITDETILATIKKVVEGNNTTINTGQASNSHILAKENTILSQYLPKTLSLEEIMSALESVQNEIKESKTVGQATGLAMKTLKAANLSVDSKVVIEAINKIRE